MGELPGKIALSRFLQEDPLYAQQRHWHGGHHYPGDHSDPAHQTGAVLFFPHQLLPAKPQPDLAYLCERHHVTGRLNCRGLLPHLRSSRSPQSLRQPDWI